MKHTGSKLTAGGLSKKEKFYQVFNGLRCRCTDKSKKDYPRYGGRGIRCIWDNYLDFKKDMYESYLEHKKNNKTTQVERIDNNGHYCKENCRWATFQEQQKNKSSNRYITHNGKTLTIADWAREINISRQSIRYRLENGWDVKSIINTPFRYVNRYNKKNGTIQTSKGLPRKKSR